MRRSTLVVGLVTVLGLAALGGCKGDAVKCEQGCRNYGTLTFWDRADKEIAAAPEAQRPALKKKMLNKFERELETGIDMCVQQCSSANNDETIDCLIAARTVEKVRACAPKEAE